ncbi:MAG: hypothetical protein A2493_01655 [Candidatus Magasanikbacteria bacterium RIFOXYC12_FULL_33_11]|uniref:Uncharacterized protein n=1 Tax=Candidatus Magasanikbacteria bacterium RIFOXYC12_FULL_33_11 TaxID=1798701 RepID=A0A1F6NM38_9BACT|nr:MAG: hypothetical protein A2493_01655 [Candidatus Magasanikbacteria bacterium RIFOXYC12_FULL_33_11]
MNLTEEEQKRLDAFQKNNQTIRGMKNFHTQKQFDESIEFYKNKLKKEYQTLSSSEIVRIFQQLSRLIAQKTSFKLKEHQELYGDIPDFIVEEEMNLYLKNSYQLSNLKKKILTKYGK